MAPFSLADGRLRRLLVLPKFAALIVLIGLFTDYIGEWVMDLTVHGVSGLLKLLRIPVYYDGIFITTAGFQMVITMECTAMQYLTIFTAAVMASPDRTYKQKASGCAVGAVVIVLFNIVRIAAVGLVGANAPYVVFDFVHTYLWQGSFLILIFILWFQWMRNLRIFRVEFLARVALALAVSTAALLIIKLSMPHYLRFLTSAADVLFRLLPLGKTVSLTSSEGLVWYACGGKACSYLIESDVYYSIPFFAVIAFFSPRLRLRALFMRAAAGLTIMACLHVIYIVIGFFFADYFYKTLAVHYLWWYEKLIVMVAPILLGLWVGGLLSGRKD